MVFTVTDPEYSVKDYLSAVTANWILNIGQEPIHTSLRQNWIHRRTSLIHTTIDGAAQQWFSILPIEIKSDWKRFTKEISKIFDSERNKQHQRNLFNDIRRLPKEQKKQLALRIENLVRKAYSLNTHDYKNTKMTEILMMNLTLQLCKVAKLHFLCFYNHKCWVKMLFGLVFRSLLLVVWSFRLVVYEFHCIKLFDVVCSFLNQTFLKILVWIFSNLILFL